jgi:hypothetical protein
MPDIMCQTDKMSAPVMVMGKDTMAPRDAAVANGMPFVKVVVVVVAVQGAGEYVAPPNGGNTIRQAPKKGCRAGDKMP